MFVSNISSNTYLCLKICKINEKNNFLNSMLKIFKFLSSFNLIRSNFMIEHTTFLPKRKHETRNEFSLEM
jgi:hypothetical protein